MNEEYKRDHENLEMVLKPRLCPECGTRLDYDPDLLGPGAINAAHWDCPQCHASFPVEPEDYGIALDERRGE